MDGARTAGGYGRLLGWLSAACAVALPLLSFAFALGLQRRLRLPIYDEQFLAAILALGLALVFLAYPARPLPPGEEPGGRVPPWYDVAAAVLGFANAAYIAIHYEHLVDEAAFDPSAALIPGLVLVVMVLEGLRRVAGLPLTLIVGLFVFYGLFGHLVPAPLTGRRVSAERLVTQVALDPSGIFGTPLLIAATIVVAFVFFGLMLSRAGGSTFFTHLAMALMGRYRGGSAKIALCASGFMGSISGSAVSNVVSTGVITIPLMRQGGYPQRTAGAIEAVASTGGQLLPPIMGAAAFLMAEFLQIPYTSVVTAALLPALLYYIALFIQVDLTAARNGIRGVPRDQIPRARPILRAGWFFPLPFATLLIALFVLRLRVEEAALWAAAVLIVLAIVIGHAGRRITHVDLFQGLKETGILSLGIIMIAAAAGIIIGVLNQSGLSFNLTMLLVQIGQHNLILLLIIAAVVSIVLGLGMPTVGVYVLLATLVAPSLVQLGIEPIAAHLFVLYYGMMSMITPPVAIAAFAAASLSRGSPMGTALEAMRFGWIAFIIPFLFVAAPSLLLIGSPINVALAVATAVAGVWLISAGIIGFLRTHLSLVQRALFVAAGGALLVPAGAFEGALLVDLSGLVLGAVLLGRQFLIARPEARAGERSTGTSANSAASGD